jgi:hypothetical protein
LVYQRLIIVTYISKPTNITISISVSLDNRFILLKKSLKKRGRLLLRKSILQRLFKYDTRGKTVSVAWNSLVVVYGFNTYRHKNFGHNKRVVLAGYKKFCERWALIRTEMGSVFQNENETSSITKIYSLIVKGSNRRSNFEHDEVIRCDIKPRSIERSIVL